MLQKRPGSEKGPSEWGCLHPVWFIFLFYHSAIDSSGSKAQTSWKFITWWKRALEWSWQARIIYLSVRIWDSNRILSYGMLLCTANGVNNNGNGVRRDCLRVCMYPGGRMGTVRGTSMLVVRPSVPAWILKFYFYCNSKHQFRLGLNLSLLPHNIRHK